MSIKAVLPEQFTQYPQGYYPFEESPAKIPPKVRKPPYLQTQVNCPGKLWIVLLTDSQTQFFDINQYKMLNRSVISFAPFTFLLSSSIIHIPHSSRKSKC